MLLQPLLKRFAFAAVLLVTLAFGWWPFNFVPANDVQWDEEATALRFNPRYEAGESSARGLAVALEPLDTRGWGGLSILVELRGRPRSGGLGVFLELREEQMSGLPALLVAQWQDHLAIRSRRSPSEVSRGYAEIGYRDGFRGDEFVQVLLVSNPERTSVYVDGELSETRSGYALLGSDNQFRGRLFIGNSADGTNPFMGEIRRIAFYDRALRPVAVEAGFVHPVVDYDFSRPEAARESSSRLEIPPRSAVALRAFLNPVPTENWNFGRQKRDMLVNALGFLPIGLCFAAAARRRTRSGLTVLALVALGSFLLSLTIELGQGYLVHRDSSQLDLLLNTISGSAAVLVPRRWISFL